MPKHKNLKKGKARLVKNASAPRDIGDPRRARVDTLKWLKGEGLRPEQFGLLFPEDEEMFERFTKDLWVSAEPDAKLGTHGVRFLLGAEDAQKDLLKSRIRNRLTPANRALSAKTTAWQDLVRTKATAARKHHGAHRDSPLQLTMKLCGLDVWDEETKKTKYEFAFAKGRVTKPANITAETVYLFLLREFPFPYSP